MVAIGLWLAGCNNDENPEPQTDDQAQSEENFQQYQALQQIWDQLGQEVNAVYEDTINQGKSGRLKSGCGDFAFFLDNKEDLLPGFSRYGYYSYIKLSFGDDACPDDWIEAGSIEIYFSGLLENRWKDSLVIKDLKIADGTEFSGYRSSMFQSEMSNASVSAFLINSSAEMSLPDGQAYAWTSSELLKFLDRFTRNEIIEKTGTASLTDLSNNYTLFAETLSPVQRKASCTPPFRYPVQGVDAFRDNIQLLNFQVDYGDGSCDSLAVLTPRFGDPFTITLP